MREKGGGNIMATFFHCLLFLLAHCVFYYHPSELWQERALPKIAERYHCLSPPSTSQFEAHCLLLGQKELLIFLENMMDCSENSNKR